MPYKFVEEGKPRFRFVEDDFDANVRAQGGKASGIENFFAGMGKAFTDLGRGAEQIVGRGPSAEEVKETRRRDAPLMATGAGLAGNITGNVLPAVATSAIPGANTYTGAALVGSTLGAFQPTETQGERLKNVALGGAFGVGGKYVGDKGGQYLADRLTSKTTELATRQGQRSAADATLKAGQEAGYVVPPSAVNPTFVGNRLESVAGKAALGQKAAIKNQEVTDRLARQFLGMADDTPLTTATLGQAREAAAAPYREVSKLNSKAAQFLDDWKTQNFESKMQWNYFKRSGDPAAYKAAKSAEKAANDALTEIEMLARQAKRPDLVLDLKKSRVQIAKIHQVEKAVNDATGSVDASVLGRAFDRGEKLTGELGTIGSFQQAFPSYMREASKIPTPGVSKSEALVGLLMGTGGALGTGSPAGMLLAAAPLLSHPTRSLLLSGAGQRALAQPQNYVPGLLYSMPSAAINNPVTQRLLPPASALGGIGYFNQQDPFDPAFR